MRKAPVTSKAFENRNVNKHRFASCSAKDLGENPLIQFKPHHTGWI